MICCDRKTTENFRRKSSETNNLQYLRELNKLIAENNSPIIYYAIKLSVQITGSS